MLLLFILFLYSVPSPSQIYTLSLHDALPIWMNWSRMAFSVSSRTSSPCGSSSGLPSASRCALISARSEEHTTELQSRGQLVCRLLLVQRKKLMQIEKSLIMSTFKVKLHI